MSENLKRVAITAIEENAPFLTNIGENLWKNPEVSFEEYTAHDLLTSALEERDFHVDRSYLGLQTAFKATFGEKSKGPNICVICEYDALPEVGHACGHNLIAEAGIAAALGIKAALEVEDAPKGSLMVMGTPAEEVSSGKILLIEKGAFDDVDLAMMVHPYPTSLAAPLCYALLELQVTFSKINTDSAGWAGLSALDAAVMAYNNVSVLRQHMMPSDRVHGVIIQGGTSVTMVPEVTIMEWNIRAINACKLKELEQKVSACFEAAALASDCSVEINQLSPLCQDLLTNKTLATLYCNNASMLDLKLSHEPTITFSTDMGNVSYTVPSIHPMYSIGDGTQVNHTRDFTLVTNTPAAHYKTLIAAKALAMTALDIFITPALLQQITNEFHHIPNIEK